MACTLVGCSIDTNEAFNELLRTRGYTFTDVITISPEKLPNYEEKLKNGDYFGQFGKVVKVSGAVAHPSLSGLPDSICCLCIIHGIDPLPPSRVKGV
ncbi:hypothetical protein EON66_04950 [archaeon]|nr:MAG: hypothetical protein EON66_04950 [archaeon]